MRLLVSLPTNRNIWHIDGFGSFFDDKQMKLDIADYATKVADAEKKLQDYEDKYYNKFSKMEVALSKLQSQNSYLTGLFGGGQ